MMGNTKASKREILEYDHEEEDDEKVETRFAYDYSKGILYEYEFHIFRNGNEYRLYKGEREVTTQEATDIISRGNCILYHSLKY